MARPREQAGRRLRAHAGRCRAGLARHRDRLLCALAVAGIGLAATAVLTLHGRAFGPLLAIGVLGVFTAELVEAA